jgi:gliding motility-associated-like protein
VLGTVTATDNCDTDLTITNNAPAEFPIGTTTVIWTVTDNAGNTTTCEQLVVVEDDEDPVITACAADVTVGTDDGTCTATNVALSTVTATDNCDTDLTITNNAPAEFLIGTTTVIWTVTDNAGNTTTCEQLVVVEDDEDPVLVCPPDVTLQNNDPGQCNAFVSIAEPVVSDNCGIATVTNSFTNTSNASGVYPIGTTTVVWTVTDVNGNMTTCEQTVTVVDVEGPVISCGENITVNTDPGQCSADLSIEPPVATDNCGLGSLVNSITGTSNASGIYEVGIHTIIWTATDINGNQSTCEQTIEVIDSEVPSITCPDDIVVSASASSCEAQVAVPQPQVSDNCGINEILNDFNNTADATGTYPLGVTTVTWTVIDVNGNESSCSMTVTVVDDVAPAIFCPENITVNNDIGSCEAFVSVPQPEIVENCGIQSVTNSVTGTNDASGVYPVGVTEVTWTVTDINGNENSCTMEIVVVDAEDPVISCPEDITLSAEAGVCEALVTMPEPDFSDNCGVESIVNDFNNTADGSGVYPVGTTTVIWTVTDLSGNTSTCSVDVTVIDDQLPEIICPADIIVENTPGFCSADVTVPSPEVSDNCGIGVIENNFTSTDDASAVYPVGTTEVTWTVFDLHGNSATCSMNVTVVDAEDPMITCPDDVVVSNDPGQCSAFVTVPEPLSTDNCGVESVINDYNNTVNASDSYPVGTTEVKWTVTDIHGNTSSCVMTVVVNDVEAPEIICPVDVVVESDGQPTTFVEVGQPTMSDNCAVEYYENSFNNTQDASGQYPLGSTIVTWTVRDVNGLTSTCEMTVTVSASSVPEITCPGDVTFITEPGECDVEVTIDQPEVDAPAGIQSVINDFNNSNDASGIYPVGDTPVTWTVTDNNNVQVQCQMVVTVIGTPDAIDDVETTLVNTPVEIMVMSNDVDCSNDLDPASLIIMANPANGKLEIDNLAGMVAYTPDTDFTGADQFDYQVCDQTGYCDIATVYITITEELNNRPVAIDDYDTTSVGVSIFIPVLLNDFDPDGDNLTVSICGDPLNGFVVVQDDNTILYQTEEGTAATYDEFCYKICDDGNPSLCDSATVFITILPDTTSRDLIIYNTITPDNDGQNDYWHIENIEYYEDNSIVIYNRWGDEIINFKGYNNNSVRWDGKNRDGNDLPDGVYYYIIEINDVNNIGPFKGWVYIR